MTGIASLLAFCAVSAAVVSGAAEGFDRSVLLAFRNAADVSDPLGPPWFEEAAAELSALGGYTILTLVTAVVAVTLILMKKRQASLFLVLAIAGGSIASTILKFAFARPRPELVAHLDRVFTASFPSGHAMVSMLAWMTLASIAVRFIESHRVRVFILAAAFGLAILIGITRIYLGVHWPSDVLAGWFLGVAWAAFCWLVAHAVTSHPESVSEFGHSRV